MQPHAVSPQRKRRALLKAFSLSSLQVAAVRDIRLFFSGGLSMKDVSYSHGVRQTMYMLFNNTPGE